ncbi:MULTISPECIES: lytic transglycosylase domain-containing protein [unclassified Phenylobacterium]|uniref:lytic transglycosylase domain-containing protein n=1 Tax=unclassified Phenylobacterium TaxID=2640670 RepID=UPI000839E78B|nr:MULTISPECIES: lytic transglycosylase domain-containing protein [unclassified Phenylobacterium]
MVRWWTLIGLAAALAGTPATAGPDWRAAGGAIFAAPVPTPVVAASGALEQDPRLPDAEQPFAAAIDEAALRHRIDPKLLHALVTVESAYRVRAVSPAGAGGLTQLMPATARDLGVADRFDAGANVQGGADYLARQLLRFRDVRLALAAYNAGPERVARLGRVPRIAETEQYVASVVDCYLALSAGRRVRSAVDCRGGGR